MTEQFRCFIEDSMVKQLDERTEGMIAEMKRKVARHRWKRAISAVRLSLKLGGGRRPEWKEPFVAPEHTGRGGSRTSANRFVDMQSMMKEAMRTQPKYFREGTIMQNLLESGKEE